MIQKDKGIDNKIGALHLRLMDDEKQYCMLLAHLLNYNKDNEHYTTDVLNALEDGLENFSRYQKLDNALSPRFIKIEKRNLSVRQKRKVNDTEGAYYVVFHFDDEKEEIVHFKRKQDQILYMLILLTSLKNGYSSEFLSPPYHKDYLDSDDKLNRKAFERANDKYFQVNATVKNLIKTVYPVDNKEDIKEEKCFTDIIQDLRPDVYFTGIVQKMKGVINNLLKEKGEQQEARWFIPYSQNIGKKRIYLMHMEPTKIIYPKEFQTIIDDLPLASDFVDMSSYVSEEMQTEDNEKLLRGVQKGDIKCMNQLAMAYIKGIGRMADLTKAFSLLKKTADLGDAEGLYYLGLFYGTGDVVSQDYTLSTHYLQKSADQGYADALYALGQYKQFGFGCNIDWKGALNYYKDAANKGCADAAYMMGDLYDRGEHGVKKDDKESFKWFLKAAELNHTLAVRHVISYVIRAYHDGLISKGGKKDYLYWVKKGFKLGIPEVYLQVGFYLHQDKEYESAFIALSAASEAGMTKANYTLAQMLINGQGVERDIDRAIEYLRDGAYANDESCLDLLKKVKPKLWGKITSELENIIDMRSALISLIGKMKPKANQDYFLQLIDFYREHFNESYQKEINKQLSIHKPSTVKDEGSRRKILVRKSSSKKARYEIVITLVNGNEIILKLNPNSLVLLLLTIICSFKSGYNTVMTLDKTCQKIMAELVRLVLVRKTEAAAIKYIRKYMDNPKKGYNPYKTYSKDAKQTIEDAIGEYDEPMNFLFDNNKKIGKLYLRSMNLDFNDIELPHELMQLAIQMPDGKDILYSLEDEDVVSE